MNNEALEVAKYVITLCNDENQDISNLHLQKILYYLQKEVLQKFDDKLFVDDIQAWQFGPVIPKVYVMWYSKVVTPLYKFMI